MPDGAPAATAEPWWQLFVPPRQFADPTYEEEFLQDYSERFFGARKVALILAMFTWAAYVSWDYFHYLSSVSLFGGMGVLQQVLGLRAVGFVLLCISSWMFFRRAFRSERRATWLIGTMVVVAYVLLLKMIEIVPFPYDYLYYYTGLLLALLFLFGFLRLRAYPVIVVSVICLVLSLATFSTVEARHAVEASYRWAAMSYLVSFMMVGCAIAAGFERTARVNYKRERDLQEANHQLQILKVESDSKTAALIATKEEARARSESQSLEKTRFLAAAAHDLRQPVQAIGTFLEVAALALSREDYLSADDSVRAAMRSGRLLSEGINSILDLSRIETGFVTPTYTSFDCALLVNEVVNEYKPIAGIRKVDLRGVTGHAGKHVVRSDRRLLKQILDNLVANAIKYSDDEKKPNSVVLVAVTKLRNRVRLNVIDNGIGIDQSQWSKIFEPFVQLDNPERDRDKGLGLGLSIVNGLVSILQAHRLEMKSTAGRGTRFSIDIPIGESARLVSPEQPSESFIVPSLRGRFVVYVEDSAVVRASTEALFREHGIIFESAANAEDAIALIRTLEMRPDVILLDYRLPEGKTAIDILQSTADALVDVPVIILSGEAAGMEGASQLKSAIRLTKPVTPGRLLLAISQAAV